MATIQLGNTKVANKLISYAEKRAEGREGVDCPPEYAKAQFKATRELWGKTEGIQAHHIIQSFKPGEVTPELANQIGQDLAKEVAKGHECVVYTHTDKAHIHNHIVINAVSFEDGSKYQSSKKDLYNIREQSDRLCLERGLSVVKEPSAHTRYTLAEKSLLDKGKDSWKDEIRESIDHIKEKTHSLEDLADQLKKEFAIETKITKKNISFKHPDSERFVRGKKLGLAYEKETLANEFERKIEHGQERGNTEVSNEQSRRSERSLSRIEEHHSRVDEGRTRIVSENDTGRGLSVNASERGYAEGNSGHKRASGDKEYEPTASKTDSIDNEAINRFLADRKRGIQEGYKQQYADSGQDDRDAVKGTELEQGNNREQTNSNRTEQPKERERIISKDINFGPER